MRSYRKSVGAGIAAAAILALGSCSNSDDDNRPLDYDRLRVNFTAAIEGTTWEPDASVGIFATCTRNESPGYSLAGNSLYRVGGEDLSLLTGATADDEIEALRSDHNYKFYAYYPYSPGITDPTALSVAVSPVQEYSRGLAAYSCFVAGAEPTTIVPDVALDFKAIFSVLELNVADDILDEEGRSVLRSITVSAPEGTDLAVGGRYDLTAGVFTPDPAMLSGSVTVDFGAEGLVLTDSYTKIGAIVAPVTVPAEGLTVTVTGIDGESSETDILAGEAATSLAAGSTVSVMIGRENDGVVPVTFPVEWLLGHGGDNRHPVTTATQPLWISSGIWTCDTQPQAVCAWHKESDPLETAVQVLETVNSGKISSVGIKGLWTDDYFEFDIPVKKFAAGTVLTMSFPLYGRQIPVFWNIDYLDGDEWKTADLSEKKAYDPSYSMECTFTAIRGAVLVRKALPYEHGVKSGHLKIRLRVADGAVQADTDTKCARRSAPWTSGGAYGAPFYFYDTTGELTSVKFSLD